MKKIRSWCLKSPGNEWFKLLRVVKIILSVMVVCLSQLSAAVRGQNVNLNLTNVTVAQAINRLEKQLGQDFFFKKGSVDVDRKVNVHLKNADLAEVVAQVFGSEYSFVIIDNMIVITPQRDVAQQVQGAIVQGVVKSKTGEAMPGVTVLIKGTTVGVVTDINGSFKLTMPDKQVMLAFSFVGMKTVEILWNGQSRLNVVMEEEIMEMDEVVVTGYQNISRHELAGAVKQVKAADIIQNSKFSVDQMLAGQVSGMLVMQTSGEPSATPKIRIRGTSSIVGSKAPLWVLDGIILDDPVSMDYSQLNGDDAAYLVGNAIAGVNPQDIETINVLKDASAAAIYGVQAANGVIVVTTKKGKSGKPRVSYNGNVSLGMRESYSNLYLMNASERIRLSQEIIEAGLTYRNMPHTLGYEGLYFRYMNKDISYDAFKLGVAEMAKRNTDWFDILFRDAVSHSHSVSLSGGDDRTTYYASLGYNDNLGTAIGSESRRYTANMKVNSWFNDELSKTSFC